MNEPEIPTTIWTLWRDDLQGAPRVTLNKGKPEQNFGIMCFTSAEKAQSFADATGLTNFNKVEQPGDFFVEWLRSEIKRGSSVIFKNPIDFNNLGKPTPIFKLLLAVEGPGPAKPSDAT